jgi:hypothetical protein
MFGREPPPMDIIKGTLSYLRYCYSQLTRVLKGKISWKTLFSMGEGVKVFNST